MFLQKIGENTCKSGPFGLFFFFLFKKEYEKSI